MILFYIRRISVAGLWIIIWWAILNILGAVFELTTITGVAYSAHIGGFVAGILLILIFPGRKRVQMRSSFAPR